MNNNKYDDIKGKKFKHGFIVMRGQPFHNGHKFLIDKMLTECENITIILGSIQESRTKRNPFTFEERKQMLLNVYGIKKNINIFGLINIPNDNEWYDYVIKNLLEKSHNFGFPDAYYCGDNENGDFFRKGDFIVNQVDRNNQIGNNKISATEIREMIKNKNNEWQQFVPQCNIKYINTLKNKI